MNLETLIAGDTLDFTIDVPDYPASDGWVLTYRLTPRFTTPTQAPIDISAATNADGKRYDVQASPSTTAAWAPGAYTWARWLAKSGARQTLDESGQLLVKPDPATTAQGLDSRSHARKELELLEAAIEALQLGAAEWSFQNRTFKREQLAELIKARSQYRIEVQAEDAAEAMRNGLGNPRYFRTRFDRP